MKASFVDLRKKSGEIIRALHRNEQVTVLYRGKPAAVMQPGVLHDIYGAEFLLVDHPRAGLSVIVPGAPQPRKI